MTETIVLQKTVITETPSGRRVEVVFADHADPEQASASIVIQLPLEIMEHPNPRLARLEALERARLVIDAETARSSLHSDTQPR